MLRKFHITALAILAIVLFNIPLFSAELTFDKASGNMSGFDIGTSDSDYNPGNYPTKGEVWTYDGFIGRLDYRGEPATMTFTNSGPIRTASPNDKFYFTDTTGGTSNPDHYREFFIVARAKGRYHGGGQDDFNNKNFVISSNGGSFEITKGAGSETAVIGQIGYNGSGGSGTYTASGSGSAFVYKYPYSYIWIDITLIRTDQNYISYYIQRWWGKQYYYFYGYYETSFIVATKNLQTSERDVHYTVQLSAQYNQSGQGNLWEYYFGIENLLPPTFPFSNLATKNNAGNTLTVGKVRYYSTNDTASLKFASNAAGTETDFRLYSTGASSFPYSVVYAPLRPSGTATTITSSTSAFNSIYTTVSSPIGGSNTGNFLEGEVKIFVAPNLLPLSGTYTSNIYCILTRTN